jgi:hypothetical protein
MARDGDGRDLVRLPRMAPMVGSRAASYKARSAQTGLPADFGAVIELPARRPEDVRRPADEEPLETARTIGEVDLAIIIPVQKRHIGGVRFRAISARERARSPQEQVTEETERIRDVQAPILVAVTGNLSSADDLYLEITMGLVARRVPGRAGDERRSWRQDGARGKVAGYYRTRVAVVLGGDAEICDGSLGTRANKHESIGALDCRGDTVPKRELVEKDIDVPTVTFRSGDIHSAITIEVGGHDSPCLPAGSRVSRT